MWHEGIDSPSNSDDQVFLESWEILSQEGKQCSLQRHSERTVHLKGQGGPWEFGSWEGCKRDGGSDLVRAAVRTSFALTPTPPASPAGLSNPESVAPGVLKQFCRLPRVKAMAFSRGTQAACRSSKDHM